MPYVYSTLTADQLYSVYPPPEDIDFKSIPVANQKIRISGGANVITKQFVTPKGIMTKVTDQQLQQLEKVAAFQNHKERGYITVESSRIDPDKAAKNMTTKDKSAPLVEEDFDPDKRPKVTAEVS